MSCSPEYLLIELLAKRLENYLLFDLIKFLFSIYLKAYKIVSILSDLCLFLNDSLFWLYIEIDLLKIFYSFRNTLELKQDWISILKLSAEFCFATNIAFSKIDIKTSLPLPN